MTRIRYAHGEQWIDRDGEGIASVSTHRTGRVGLTVVDSYATFDADELDALIALLVEQRAALRGEQEPGDPVLLAALRLATELVRCGTPEDARGLARELEVFAEARARGTVEG